ncbi:MAG: hypothetical protein ACLTSL_05120 [Odoribacter splanchnicus]
MKSVLFILLGFVCFSCSNNNDLAFYYISRLDSLENVISKLSNEKDSLAKMAIRWEYGRDSYLYADDFKGGSSVSWRYARSLDQLKFDTDLLNKSKIEVSNDNTVKWSTLSVDDIVFNLDRSEAMQEDYVDTDFEADRFNYYISVVCVNAINEAIYTIACDLAKDGDTCNANRGYVVSTYAGLLYKHLYNDTKNYDKFVKTVSETVEYVIKTNYLK